MARAEPKQHIAEAWAQPAEAEVLEALATARIAEARIAEAHTVGAHIAEAVARAELGATKCPLAFAPIRIPAEAGAMTPLNIHTREQAQEVAAVAAAVATAEVLTP